MSKLANQKKYLNLALQGGGSHGAFTWGVLDRLLEEENLKFEGLSGTSAGAINAALVATGIVSGGRKAARQKLDKFWMEISQAYSGKSLSSGGSFFQYIKFFDDFWIGKILSLFSPYDFAAGATYEPLKEILDKHIDYECLRNTEKIKIYICATNVETNRIKVFTKQDICTAALLASSCLPTIRKAVEWNGEFYWDGGFMGNPMLEPLIYHCLEKDILIVQVNPINKKGVPKTHREILDRLNEITFNSSLMREIRGIVNIQKLSNAALCSDKNPYALLRLHIAHDEDFMGKLGSSSKFNTEMNFLLELKEKGRKTADRWLKKNFDHIGVETTMDLSKWHIETPTTTCLEWGE